MMSGLCPELPGGLACHLLRRPEEERFGESDREFRFGLSLRSRLDVEWLRRLLLQQLAAQGKLG